MSTPILILTIAGAAVVFFSGVVLIAFVRSRRLGKAPPPPPFKCASCGSERIDVVSSGLWDGEDSAGRGTGGTRAVGMCKNCGVHCEHVSMWDNDEKENRYECRVLTDEQWQRETAFIRRQQTEWPVVSEGRNDLA